MAVYDYAEKFESLIQEKYAEEAKSNFLVHTNPQVKFINAQTIKVPNRTLSGYGNHNRGQLGFNSAVISNDWTPYKLEWDRDLEYFMDPEDIDETNLVLSFANLQNQVEEEVTIPEKDKYRFSKLYKEAVKNGVTIDTDVLTVSNVLAKFDAMMEKMDEGAVREGQRKLLVTPHVYTMLKNAEGIQRTLEASGAKNINRMVHSLDDVEIIKVSSDRFKTNYVDKDVEGFKSYVAAEDAKQINMILIDPSAVICEDKYSYIKVFTPGSDSRTADKYVYQNRYYSDLFLIPVKKDGIAINAEA